MTMRQAYKPNKTALPGHLAISVAPWQAGPRSPKTSADQSAEGLTPLTFRQYDIGDPVEPGHRRDLLYKGQMTTTVDQVALAFTSPSNLPAPGVYEQAIRAGLASG